MKTEQIHLTATCVGIYRPRPGNHGFGIPVFESMGQYGLYVQVVKDGVITDFQECDVDREVLIKDGATYCAVHIGDKELCAFETVGGTIIMCDGRDRMKRVLSDVIELNEKQFMKTPFVLCDIAEYIGDRGLLDRAKRKCVKMLEATRQKGKRTS